VFGASTSLNMDGRLLAVGSPYQTDGDQARSGEVTFFEDIGFDGSSRWVQTTRRPLHGRSADDWFGWSVSLSDDGSRVVVGAPIDPSRREPGYVLIYDFNGFDDRWEQIGDLSLGGEGDRFGYSVSLGEGGDRLAVGAPRAVSESQTTGQVMTYQFRRQSWSNFTEPLQGENDGDNFGLSVSLSRDGSHIAVGAPYLGNSVADPDQGNQASGIKVGMVRVYRLKDEGWWGGLEIDPPGDVSLGFSASLSANGGRLGVGVPTANEARVYEKDLALA